MSTLGTIAAITGVALTLAGCGESAQQKTARIHHRQQLAAQAEHRRAVAKAHSEYETCSRRLQPFLKALRELKGHEAIGLNESDYASRLGDVQALASELPHVSEVGVRCGAAMIPAMRANINEVAASEYWARCIESLACDEATKKRTIESKWSKGDHDLDEAETRLTTLKTPESSP